jgi:hypothetical protein
MSSRYHKRGSDDAVMALEASLMASVRINFKFLDRSAYPGFYVNLRLANALIDV